MALIRFMNLLRVIAHGVGKKGLRYHRRRKTRAPDRVYPLAQNISEVRILFSSSDAQPIRKWLPRCSDNSHPVMANVMVSEKTDSTFMQIGLHIGIALPL
jgi:hypothetical protein